MFKELHTPTITHEDVNAAIQNAVRQITSCLPEFTTKFQCDASVNNFYLPSENISWTTGFWTGELWLAYEATKDETIRKAAETHVADFLRRIEDKIDVNHHDMGFLYSPSCVAAYNLIDSEEGRKAALLAADNLISRFNPTAGFLQAWGNVGADDNNRLIIDCLLNLPLLYWASKTTGNPKYAQIAQAHTTTALKNIMREDHSTYHTYFFDKTTGKPLYGATHQGNRDGSAWARGQAWGVYGVALARRYTQNDKYIPIFRDITDYFLEHLPSDLIPYWDFDFTDGSTEPRDSSASAIAVCGMLEMAKYMDKAEAERYTTAALQLLKALYQHCAVTNPKDSNGLLLHSTYARSSEHNTCRNIGVDECNTWGDYFYLEALTRAARPDWNLYW